MKQVLLILLLSIFFCDIHSEEVAGVVFDENNRPLPYSTIRVKKKRIATLGDRSGRFSISSGSICPNDTISVTYIGYEPLEFSIGEIIDSVQI